MHIRNLSSLIISSENQSPSSLSKRSAPFNPFSYDVTRGISPEIRNMSSRTVCVSLLLLTVAPASSISSNVGSASSETIVSPIPKPR